MAAEPARKPTKRQRRHAPDALSGTPKKLNRQVIEQLVAVLEKGVYLETAAAYVGVHKDTFYDWLKRGRRDITAGRRSLYREVVEAVEKAMAKFEVDGIDRLAVEEQWQATAWRLERRFPDRYGRRTRLEHTGDGGGPVQMRIDVSKLSDDELAALEGMLEKARPGGGDAGRSASTRRGARRSTG